MKLWCVTRLIAIMIIVTSTAGASEIYNKNGNTLSIFGNIAGGQYFSKNNVNEGSNMFVRYGLIGKTYINDAVFGFGTWEHEFSLKNNEEGFNIKNDNYAILGYVGMKFGDFGSFDYGRNYGILYHVESWTDLVPEFGGDVSISDNFMSGRASNVLTYRNNNFFGLLDGFDFSVQYQGKNSVDQFTGRTIKTANGEGYGVSASYAFSNGISTAAAYSNSGRTLEQRNLDNMHTNKYAEAYYLGIKYNAHQAYMAAIYGETYNMTPFGNFNDNSNSESIYGFINKARNVSVIAQYRFNCGLIPSISYLHSKASDIENGYGSYLKKCVTIGSSYLFNKQFSTTLDYRINLLNKNDFTTAAQISIDNVLAVGVSYLF